LANSNSMITNNIKKVLSGHPEYFNEMVETYKGLVFKICLELMKNEQDALDMSQEVFIKIYNNLDKFKFKSKFTTWVYKICVNTCLTELKKKHRLNLPLEEGLDYGSSPSPEELLEGEEIIELIKEEISRMSPKKRNILKLRSLKQYTFDKIAEILKIPSSSARTEYTRAKAQLAESIEKYNKGE
jgi:RNA polymerase sigma-70 factor, ECF subfamily